MLLEIRIELETPRKPAFYDKQKKLYQDLYDKGIKRTDFCIISKNTKVRQKTRGRFEATEKVYF